MTKVKFTRKIRICEHSKSKLKLRSVREKIKDFYKKRDEKCENNYLGIKSTYTKTNTKHCLNF